MTDGARSSTFILADNVKSRIISYVECECFKTGFLINIHTEQYINVRKQTLFFSWYESLTVLEIVNISHKENRSVQNNGDFFFVPNDIFLYLNAYLILFYIYHFLFRCIHIFQICTVRFHLLKYLQINYYTCLIQMLRNNIIHVQEYFLSAFY